MARLRSTFASIQINGIPRAAPVRVTAVAVASALVLAATIGCDHQDTPKTTPRPTASTSPSGPALTERDALTAYRGMWNAFVEAGKTSNPDYQPLRTYASGDALKLIVGALVTNQHENKVILGELQVNPKIASATPPEAPIEVAISDCVNDEKWLVYYASGSPVNDEPGGRHQTTATVTQGSDGWKVSRFVIGDQSC